MLSRGGELMAGHPYCQAWLGAEGLLLRREVSQNPAMLQGKDRFFGGFTDSVAISFLFNVSKPVA